MRNNTPFHTCTGLIAATVAAGLSVCPTSHAQAAYKVLYNFQGAPDGAYPESALTVDSNNNLYGVTTYGGDSNCSGAGCGVVFKVSGPDKEKVLYTFSGPDGRFPVQPLLLADNGDLYGTTTRGGTYDYGTVYKLTKSGKETVLYIFTGQADGGEPAGDVASGSGPLIRDAAGNLYGTTSFGGDLNCVPSTGGSGCGVVYKVSKGGRETVLYAFTGPDGAVPNAGLLADASGNLYGTTIVGGSANAGAVFKIDNTGKESTLYSFSGGADGAYPESNLIEDAQGNLYSTTAKGGEGINGVAFELTQSGQENVLYAFYGDQDGGQPWGLVTDANGNFYGAAFSGGSHYQGVVFRIDSADQESALYNFGRRGGVSGDGPHAGLAWGSNGKLYGTANSGGSLGFGTVFELTP